MSAVPCGKVKTTRSRAVRFIAGVVLGVGMGVLGLAVIATIGFLGWAFIEEWPYSGYGVGLTFVVMVIMSLLMLLFLWAWRVVSNKDP